MGGSGSVWRLSGLFWTLAVALIATGDRAFFAAGAERQSGLAGPQIQVPLGGGVTLALKHIASGEFNMGSSEPAKETVAFFNEKYGADLSDGIFEQEHPYHRVRISKPYYLGVKALRDN